MGLTVIGAGLGRTGTMSLKLALEALDLGPCYHMTEVFPNPAAPALWVKAADGRLDDWEEIFAGYNSTTDWPGCTFYLQLAERYPQAKVILSVRDPDKWFDSTQATIFADATGARFGDPIMQKMMDKIVFSTFGGLVHDRAHCIAALERHNQEVIAAVPPERLLVYDVAEGWAPLCRFLQRPAPDAAFPRVNTSEEFHGRHLPDAVTRLGI